MLRRLVSAVAVASMLMSSAAFAADNTEQGALAPGSAAGIHEAQGMDLDLTMSVFAAAIVVIGIALVVTSAGNGSHTSPGAVAS
jgi:hypothetical protein